MKIQFFIPGTSPISALRSIFEVALKLLYFLKPISSRRYIQLTPSICSTQKLYDRKTGKVLHFTIRNFVDFSTLAQVYLVQDYAIDLLRRYSEIREIYDLIIKSDRTPLIIDCGGNIGLASRYFSENFPEAEIICVEPDGSNIAQARLNNTSTKISYIQAAVGCEPGSGVIANPERWNNSFQIRREEGGVLSIITINDILAQYSPKTHEPFLIKIDIEGFEAELFSRNVDWVRKFPLLTLELHDWMLPGSASSSNFLQTIAPLGRDFVIQRENIWSIANFKSEY
jgi:FkbM family methyltransferase